ncbi:nudix hydrolase family protein YffH [Klebsiella pneumoniae]|uniref:Nudix hydrolase family protein YffH n=1 Tax=Klebsiella pneumoniae TaxID=573 RepID=A0A377TZN4_KLEPN|nr:nudix hydrolase family protein YffH [Klebsiella pneumoniae]
MSLNIHVIKDKILSENWFVLRNMTYELTRADGSVVRHKREVYDRGNGATVLLYNRHTADGGPGASVPCRHLGQWQS